MNTHTRVEDFNTACQRLSQLGINVIAHLILGLPGETKEMMFESVRHIASLRIFGVKLQLLHVLKGTDLAEEYARGAFEVLTQEHYIDLLIRCLEQLSPETVIHRLTGDGPRELLIAPQWSLRKRSVLNALQHELKVRNAWQGKYFSV